MPPSHNKNKPLHKNKPLLLSTFALLLISAMPAMAKMADQRSIRMAAQPLHDALAELGDAFETTIVARGDLTAGKTAPAISGTYSLEDALDQLLQASNLSMRRSRSGAIIIEQGLESTNGKESSAETGQDNANDAAAPKERIEEILVFGRPIRGYQATDALTSTKIDALLKDLPITAAVIPHQLIEDRSINYLGEALDNVSGVQRKLGYGGTQNFGAYIRGFDAGFITLRNGFRDFGWYTMRDIANVERFEVHKGPASIIYGALQPGGITNTVTKQPVVDPLLDVGATFGSFNYLRGDVDAGGPIANDWFYRLNVAYEDSDSYRDLVTKNSWFLAPVLSWVPNEKTRWTLEVEAKNSEFVWDLGLPRSIEVLDVPASRFLGENDRQNDVDSFLVSSVVEHSLSAAWRFRQNIHYSTAGGDYYLRSPLSVLDDGRTVFREAFDSPADSDTYDIQHELVGDLELFGVRNQAMVGIQFYRMVDTYDFELQPLDPIDLFEPVYGATPGPGFPLFGNEVTSDAWAVYAQNLVSITSQVKLLVGARYDEVRTENYDRLGESLIQDSKDTRISPQIGLVYQPNTSTSIYGSYSTSFMPYFAGRTVDGSSLEPQEGEQYEVGVKQELADGKLSVTMAAYSITKQNVSAADLQNPGFRVQVGEQKSQGVELDVFGAILPGWDIILCASYIDAYVSRDTVLPEGTPLDNAPDWSGNLWTKFSVDDGRLKGLRLGAGLYGATERQVSSFFGTPLFDLPSYVRVDAMIGYETDRWSVQLNGKNLTDEIIYDFMGTTIMPQESRSWVLSVRASIMD